MDVMILVNVSDAKAQRARGGASRYHQEARETTTQVRSFQRELSYPTTSTNRCRMLSSREFGASPCANVALLREAVK